ncbi:DUF58 domain-containing protein [Photobacterium sanguinicancri]|uniref:DUF58 domain-containing protein n=1 Tax=Photobacterium sanguinicancri TaxID=875932 RepID=A0ABX4FX55_9GAMM|nr:DUF58 domain-containing protein [Photobacterium sanguinicancri]OZS43413.1 DUF58 domain-containing protein [Photobacterium sanguinicancri]
MTFKDEVDRRKGDTSKHSSNHSSKQLDERIYCDYSRLVRLQAQVDGFSFLPQRKAGSALSGRHHSSFRGRGLNFEELRHYQQGDDIRNLDWKVTMRTGKPHVRSYTEEKDRSVILCVDQRSSMFFSSVNMMKSVVAAEIAALTAWRVLKDSDRVGFVISRHDNIEYSMPKRSQANVLSNLNQLAQANQALDVSRQDSPDVGMAALVRLLGRLKCRNNTIIFLSDWSGVTSDDILHLKHLQKHNDVLGVLIADPLESAFVAMHSADIATDSSTFTPWVVGDGDYQFNLANRQQMEKARQGLEQHHQLKKQQLLQLMAVQHLPMIELDTQGLHLEQFKRAVGGR